jgi:hypothetical protein
MEVIVVKEYTMVYLNKGFKLSREKDLGQAQTIINEYVAKGWQLQQVVSPSDMSGVLVGVFYKEH